jgi:hypothetical protein
MKIRIGGLEIVDVSPEELDELIKRYGGAVLEPSPAVDSGKQHPTTHTHKVTGQGPADSVVLRKLVDAGALGVTTTELGEILGRRGKATRHAVRDWAKRVGLTTDDNIEVFEEARVGTQRGLRIKPSLLEVAKELLGRK